MVEILDDNDKPVKETILPKDFYQPNQARVPSMASYQLIDNNVYFFIIRKGNVKELH